MFNANTSAIFEAIAARIEKSRSRSAWDRGVKEYAAELLENLSEAVKYGYIDLDDLNAPNMVDRAMLNGAADWSQYSWGGCSLCYNGEIAARLCTASELKRTANGAKKPNAREEWLDTQARALHQAADRVRAAALAVALEMLPDCTCDAAAVFGWTA